MPRSSMTYRYACIALQATIYNRKWNFFPLLPTRHHQTSTVDTCLQWDNYSPSPQASLCSKHFKPECFQTGGKKKVLKRSAVPSLFDFPHHLQPRPLKERRILNRAEATTPPDVAEVNNVQSQQITSHDLLSWVTTVAIYCHVISLTWNSEVLDGTAVVTLPWCTASSVSDLVPASQETPKEHQRNVAMPHSGCYVKDCRVCCAVVAYIAGFVVWSVSDKFPYADWKTSMRHSQHDPCQVVSLIALKNYKSDGNYDSMSGLIYSSGSVTAIVLETEQQTRSKIISYPLQHTWQQ